MPDDTATVTTKGLQGLLAYARRHQADGAAALASAGLTLSEILDSDARVSRDRWAQVWSSVATQLKRPALAMHVAVELPFGAFDVLDYIAATSETVRDGLIRVTGYFRLIHERVELELEESGATSTLNYRSNDDAHPAVMYSAEFSFACFLLRFRHTTGVPWRPVRMEFQHERPSDDPIYEQVFECPVHFGCSSSRMVFASEVLDYPLLQADPLLSQVLQRHAEELLRKLPPLHSFRDEVRQAVHRGLLDGEPGVERTAQVLGMTVRTLQRRLKEEDTSFQQIVDDVRRQLAEGMLAEPSMGIGEIGFFLGFSEPSAFHRAFRRWTGSTPGEFRRDRVRTSGA